MPVTGVLTLKSANQEGQGEGVCTIPLDNGKSKQKRR